LYDKLKKKRLKTKTLMVKAYSNFEGFPTPAENPNYYKILANIGGIKNLL